MLSNFLLHKDFALGVNTSDKILQKELSLSWILILSKYKHIKLLNIFRGIYWMCCVFQCLNNLHT